MRVDAPCWWKNRCQRVLFTAGFAVLSATIASNSGSLAADLSRIEIIVVIYAENRSFDHLYGLFPGANGLSNATREQTLQRDHDGSELPYLTVWDNHGKPHPKYPRLPNAPSSTISVYAIEVNGDLKLLQKYPTGKDTNWVEIVDIK